MIRSSPIQNFLIQKKQNKKKKQNQNKKQNKNNKKNANTVGRAIITFLWKSRKRRPLI